MLAADPEIAWLDGRHLRNWWALALPPGIASAPRLALLVLDQGSLFHAIVLGSGAVDVAEIPFCGTGRAQLSSLRKQLEVDGLLVLERSALADLFEAFDRGLKVEDDYAVQGIGMWHALRRSEGIWTDPPLLDLIPPLRADALQKTFDLLVPDDSALVVYVMENKRVHCSGIALKEEGSITLATMQPAIGDLITERELCRDWRANYTRVNQAVTSRLAKPSIAVYIERRALLRILRGPADQLATELKQRNLIVDPAPVWLQGLLGGAAVAAVATKNAKLVARFLPKGARKVAGDLAVVAQERIKESSVKPFAMLGFDPIELLVRLRRFYR